MRKTMTKYEGIFLGFFETGTEGILPALQESKYIDQDGNWNQKGLQLVEPNDKIIIYEEKNKLFDDKIKVYYSYEFKEYTIIYKSEDILVEWRDYNEYFGKFCINGMFTDYIPKNIDFKLWTNVFFSDCENYHGILLKK